MLEYIQISNRYTEVDSSLPAYEFYSDVIYIPFCTEVFFDRDLTWGIYKKNGSLVPAAAYTRGSPPILVGQSWKTDLNFDNIEEAPVAEYIYAGPLIPHYGHFVLTSLARLWPILHRPRNKTKILFHANGVPTGWFQTAFVRDLLAGLGLKPDDFAVFSRPVRISNLIVPGPSFCEEASAHKVFAETCHRIGETLLGEHKNVEQERTPLFLSKSRLTTGVGRLQNETDLLTALGRLTDIEIVYPEELPLWKQVSLFRSERLIVGMISSAMHTSIFSAARPSILALSYRRAISTNFTLIDQINENDATYLYPSQGFEEIDRGQHFLELFRASNPDELASDLAAVIIEKFNGALPKMSHQVPILPINLPDHRGTEYKTVLSFLHKQLSPKTYLEMGTLNGNTLALSCCASIAIDPEFQVRDLDIIGEKPSCFMFQTTSDNFFNVYNPEVLFAQKIDFAFLDGMHKCEYVLRDFRNTEKYCKNNSLIILHDCLPLELPMAEREQGQPAVQSHRNGWWTGDIWRTVRALKRHRPDLSISAFDASPTGLVIITNLNSSSNVLFDNYDDIVSEMFDMDLSKIGIENYFKEVQLQSADLLMVEDQLYSRYHL